MNEKHSAEPVCAKTIVGRALLQKFLARWQGAKMQASWPIEPSKAPDQRSQAKNPARLPRAQLQGSARAGWLLVSAFHSRHRSCSGLGASTTIGALTL